MKKYWVVFDMDGVISDTQKYHGQVEAEIFAQYGIRTISPESNEPITPQWIGDNFAGVQPKEWMRRVFDAHNKGDQFDMHRIENEKNTLLYDKYKAWAPIVFMPWARAFIEQLYRSWEYIMAVVTASNRECMLFVLQTLWVDHMFNELVSIYDIDPQTWNSYTSKWDPVVYERLVEKYTISKFVMIEDGATWMNGAVKAWGKAIAIIGDNNAGKFPQAISHHVDLTTLSVEGIESILVLDI